MAEYYGIHYDSVIEHHGIKGQKWGVRRYQNPDGTLTPLGREKFAKVASSRVKKRLMTRTARRIAKRSAKTASKTARSFESAAIQQRTKAEKSTDPNKAFSYREKAKHNFKTANAWKKQAKYAQRYLSDLDSGKKKAGIDFITASSWKIAAITSAGIVFEKETNIIDPKNHGKNPKVTELR